MWGTPQRSRLISIGASAPVTRNVPVVFGRARRKRRWRTATGRRPSAPWRLRRERRRSGGRGAGIAGGGGEASARPGTRTLNIRPPAFAAGDQSSSPAGSRPSSSSFSRWACIATAAAGRRTSGTSSQAGVEQRRPRALAGFERGDELRLALAAVLEVLVDLRGGVGDPGAVAGAHQDGLERAQPLERGHVVGKRAAEVRGGTIVEPSPRTRSPQKTTSPSWKQTWSAAWPGVGTTEKGPAVSTADPRAGVGEERLCSSLSLDLAPHQGRAQQRHRLGVVGV